MQIRLCILALLLFGWTGCESGPSPENRFDKMATGYCECTGTLAALNKQAQALAADKSKQAELSECFRKIQTEYAQVKECAASMVGQFGRQDNEALAAIQKALVVKCPALAGQEELLRELLGK